MASESTSKMHVYTSVSSKLDDATTENTLERKRTRRESRERLREEYR